jgi:ferrous iron transport protein B
VSLLTVRSLNVALIGNPNTGKSTLFSALAGIRQRVGNYPGVTVEKKTGRMDYDGHHYELIDLPGLYSLSPRSRDEMVSVDVLLGRGADMSAVDAVVCIVDAGNLERNLYLVSQVLELGVPTVVALNMLDVAGSRGISIDVDGLGRRLGIPVVATQANRRVGLAELKAALAGAIGRREQRAESPLPAVFQAESRRLEAILAQGGCALNIGQLAPHFVAQRLLLDRHSYLQKALLPPGEEELPRELEAARKRLATAGCAAPAVETAARYAWARQILDGVVTRPSKHVPTRSDRIDRYLTHRVGGGVILALVMFTVFQAVFVWAEPAMNLIDRGVELLSRVVENAMAEGALRSLLIDGVIRGAGGVLTFLPQIAILFLFIGILEDCGYMARAAYLMDKMMVRVGLSGKSFLPMLSSFACAIPGIMAARVVENERDRFTTILVAPLLTCSARLPVYALLIAAFIPGTRYLGGLVSLRGLTLTGLYVLGIVAAVLVALVLKRTVFRGQSPLFLMELPSYKWPSLRTIFFRVVERAVVFLRCAGTLILAVSILTWAAAYYPHRTSASMALESQCATLQQRLDRLAPGDPQREVLAGQRDDLHRQLSGQMQRQSYLGRAGHLIEPAVKPLGWDWRIGCAVIASFPAREVVVATLGVIFNVGEDSAAKSSQAGTQFQQALRDATWDRSDRPLFNVPVALSVMVFFALCAQCVATLAVIRRETNSWRWPVFTFTYMTTLAYVGALITFQLGSWIGRW